jgi:hypothetical protein
MADTGLAPSKPQTLDDVMIAMDVVDTLRHREDLVRRELNEEGRESELIDRLRQIYRDQGIEVPDRVLADGVKALKESRFVYTPPPSSWKRTLLTGWVKRDTYGKRLGIALAGLLMVLWGITSSSRGRRRWPRSRPASRLPRPFPKRCGRRMQTLWRWRQTTPPSRRQRPLLADGERAIRAGDKAAMTKIGAELSALRDELTREYTLTIVSRVGESTGVWRRPPAGSQARNYYLIVEPVAADGRKLSIPVRNEETGAVETVSKFGVRVPEATFEAVAKDKRDDGIVQKNQFGVKRRGMLATDYRMPFEGGFITKW